METKGDVATVDPTTTTAAEATQEGASAFLKTGSPEVGMDTAALAATPKPVEASTATATSITPDSTASQGLLGSVAKFLHLK